MGHMSPNLLLVFTRRSGPWPCEQSGPLHGVEMSDTLLIPEFTPLARRSAVHMRLTALLPVCVTKYDLSALGMVAHSAQSAPPAPANLQPRCSPHSLTVLMLWFAR